MNREMLTKDELATLHDSLRRVTPEADWACVDDEETDMTDQDMMRYSKLVLWLKEDVAKDEAWALRRAVEVGLLGERALVPCAPIAPLGDGGSAGMEAAIDRFEDSLAAVARAAGHSGRLG